jgi:hypothetical protein
MRIAVVPEWRPVRRGTPAPGARDRGVEAADWIGATPTVPVEVGGRRYE